MQHSPCSYGENVPASILMYGSILIDVTSMSQQFSNVPNELAITPLPTPLITPPVTNIYFIVNLFCSTIAWLLNLRGAILKNFGTLHKNRKHTDCRWRMLKRICEQRCRTARKWNCAQHSEHNQRLFFFLFILFIYFFCFISVEHLFLLK